MSPTLAWPALTVPAGFSSDSLPVGLEFLGLSPVGYNTIPALDPRKEEATRQAGALAMELLRRGQKPREVVTTVSHSAHLAME